MNPVWCPTPGFLDELELPSIETLDFDLRINFGGTIIPNKLKSDRSYLHSTTNFQNLLNELKIEPTDDNTITKFYLSYHYNCYTSIILTSVCNSRRQLRLITEGSNLPFESYQYLEDGSRLTKLISGYSLRVFATATVSSFAFSGFLMIAGLGYFSTLIIKNTIVFFLANKSQIKMQANYELDLKSQFKRE